jgi:hypothetical protein
MITTYVVWIFVYRRQRRRDYISYKDFVAFTARWVNIYIDIMFTSIVNINFIDPRLDRKFGMRESIDYRLDNIMGHAW